jgi:hypothetical protein
MLRQGNATADIEAVLPTLQQVRDGLLLDVGRRLPAERCGRLCELLAYTQGFELLNGALLRRRLADHTCCNQRFCERAGRLGRGDAALYGICRNQLKVYASGHCD